MPIRLRPHHLLCMLTFKGHGYSPDFVANFEQIVERLRQGERVRLIDGPDDVCAPVCERLADRAHCLTNSVVVRDRAARSSLSALPQLADLIAASSFRLDPTVIAQLRLRFADASIRSACAGCEWSPLCSQIAAGGFRATRL